MKILIFFSSHRQLQEYSYSSDFFNRSDFFKNNCEIIAYCDNDAYTKETLEQYIHYNAKTTIIKGLQKFPSGTNTGLSGNGIHLGLSECFNMFKNYDYVINMVPDCYFTRDKEIQSLLIDELNTENAFIVDYHPEHNSSSKYTFACDFFVFKPQKIINIFKNIDMNDLKIPERFLYDQIIENNIPYRTIQRIDSVNWNIDSYGLIHNHDLGRIKSILDAH